MKEIVQHLGDAIDLVTVHETKFTKDQIQVMLFVPYEPEKSPAYALAFAMLAQSCRKYPNNTAISAYLDDLYGTMLGAGSNAFGNTQRLMLSIDCIADKYAFDGEALFREAVQLAADCLLDPNVKDGAFDPGEFAIQKREAIDAIRNEILNLRLYARRQFHRVVFEGEAAAHDTAGTLEQVEALTPQSVYAAYQELMRRASVRIYCVGPDVDAAAFAPLRDGLLAIPGRAPAPFTFLAPSPLKPAPRYVRVPMSIQQSKFLMGFKHEAPVDQVALRVFHQLFGLAPTSLLFANVREKMSLCYYCVSFHYPEKQTMVVESGIDAANAERVQEAVLAQLRAAAEGQFSDALLADSKRSLINGLRSTDDSCASILGFAFNNYRLKREMDADALIERTRAVGREDIMAVASTFRLDTVYLLEDQK